ncbi:UNVERIFIED_CONTAM: UDP-glycosyltransferase 74B1 [Sesamum calycinum]|uniref:UDP-glycosyltransferase 74B1 n=1 Tax=Sesamum calycinum TaxID=2727403 RepID=A0AAW2P923_9LAMI
MDNEETCIAHVVVLAYHGQGHINPMVQFSKRLAAKGIKVTVTTTLSNTKAMKSVYGPIKFETIYDDCTEGGVAGPGGFKGFLDRFEAIGSRNLVEFIRKFQDSEKPVKCLIYDANIPWPQMWRLSWELPGLPSLHNLVLLLLLATQCIATCRESLHRSLFYQCPDCLSFGFQICLH